MLGAVRIFLQSLRLKFHIDMEVSHSWGHSWPYESSIYTWGYHQNRCFIGTPMKHPIPINGTSYKWNIHGIPSFLHLLFIILMEHPIGTSIFNRISTMKSGPLGTLRQASSDGHFPRPTDDTPLTIDSSGAYFRGQLRGPLRVRTL